MKQMRALPFLLSLLLLFALAAPVGAEAAGGGVAVDGSTAKTLRVVLPPTVRSSATALSVRISVQGDGIDDPRFEFTGEHAVQQALYDSTAATLTLYVADPFPLFGDGEESLELGRITHPNACFAVQGAVVEAAAGGVTIGSFTQPDADLILFDPPAQTEAPETSLPPDESVPAESLPAGSEALLPEESSVSASYGAQDWQEDEAFNRPDTPQLPWYVWLLAAAAAVLLIALTVFLLRLSRLKTSRNSVVRYTRISPPDEGFWHKKS